MFIRKVGWESCGRDGCGEEDGGSKVRRWRHLKSHGHQGLEWQSGELNALQLFGSRSKVVSILLWLSLGICTCVHHHLFLGYCTYPLQHVCCELVSLV